MWEFDPSHGSQAVPRLATVCNLRLIGREIPGFSRIWLCLQTPDLATCGVTRRKVSGRFPKNSRFAETIGGDWFDHDSRPRTAVGSKLIRSLTKAYECVIDSGFGPMSARTYRCNVSASAGDSCSKSSSDKPRRRCWLATSAPGFENSSPKAQRNDRRTIVGLTRLVGHQGCRRPRACRG